MSRTRRSCSDCSMPTIPMASKACQVRIRWAEEEIGRNSVMPWTMARMAIWRSDKWAIPGEEAGPGGAEIGRASCRERGCNARLDLGGRRTIKQKKKEKFTNIK